MRRSRVRSPSTPPNFGSIDGARIGRRFRLFALRAYRGDMKTPEAAAGNGLLDRRAFLRRGGAFAATLTGYAVVGAPAPQPLPDDPCSLVPGAITRPCGDRSHFEERFRGSHTNPRRE